MSKSVGTENLMSNHTDVLIVGAGVSGVGIAIHLTEETNKTFTILEGRNDLGGTWDLFQYPGIRSDSDMLTFSYKSRPWLDDRVLSPGAEIKKYVDTTATEYGFKKHIRFNTWVEEANFDTATNIWTVTAQCDGKKVIYTANFLVGSTGYYDYDNGFKPDFPGESTFKGKIIHPQHWPEKIDYVGKKFIVIGSGATAVTLVPNLVELGAHATMLQRTPTWLINLPLVDWIYSKLLRRIMTTKMAFAIARWRLILRQWMAYQFFQAFPKLASWYLLWNIKREVGNNVDTQTHFKPPYNPWDQRLCVIPDNDLFKCLKSGEAEVVTDKIKTFDKTGIVTESGRHLDADYIVSATGLNIKFMGGIQFKIDGKPALDLSKTMLYKATLTNALPNFALILGYINQSWTLKVDLVGEYLAKLFKEMDKRNASRVWVDSTGVKPSEEPIMGQLSSAYIWRSAHLMPKQGDKPEFIVDNNYLNDRSALLNPTFNDGYIKFQ